MCKAKCMVTPLKPNMPPDVQQFFMDPVDVAVKLHKQLLKVLDFQRSQRKRLTGLDTTSFYLLMQIVNKTDLIKSQKMTFPCLIPPSQHIVYRSLLQLKVGTSVCNMRYSGYKRRTGR